MWYKTVIVLGVIVLFALLLNSGRYLNGGPISDTPPDSVWAAWKKEIVLHERSEKISGYFQNLKKRRRFSGTILIAEKGKIIHQGAYGYANNRKKDTLNIHTPFQLASVSKPFTACAVLLLYQNGQIHLDSTMQKYMPDFPYEGLTVRHLLTHRSGMGRYDAYAGKYWKDWKLPMTNEDVMDQFEKHKPAVFFTPNTGFNYCNTNYVFLALLVERVSHISFPEFMKRYIFEPLEMNDASIYSNAIDESRDGMAIGHKGWGRRLWAASNDCLDGVYGDKNMYASVTDLWKFEKAVQEGKLLNPELWDEAFSPGSPRRRHNYGLGWRLKISGDSKLIYHFGWWRGFRTCYIRDIEADRTIIILTNQDVPGRNLNYWRIYDNLLQSSEV